MGIVEFEQLRIAEEIGRLGSFSRDLETDRVEWSIGLRRLLYLEDDVKPSIELWMSMVDPEYRQLSRDRAAQTPLVVRQPTIEVPMIPFEGSQRIWLRLRSRTVLMHGRRHSIGVAYDITPQMQQRREIEELNGKLVAVNKELADLVTLMARERQFRRSE